MSHRPTCETLTVEFLEDNVEENLDDLEFSANSSAKMPEALSIKERADRPGFAKVKPSLQNNTVKRM